jgi:hypothetical protein
MKKISTAATKQSRNFSRQKLTIGLDLGDRNSWYCVLDEAGRIQLEQRVRTTAKVLQEVFGAMPRRPFHSGRVRRRASFCRFRLVQAESIRILSRKTRSGHKAARSARLHGCGLGRVRHS